LVLIVLHLIIEGIKRKDLQWLLPQPLFALSDVYIGAKVNQTYTSVYLCDKENATVDAFVGVKVESSSC
jgi:hypothetical protein